MIKKNLTAKLIGWIAVALAMIACQQQPFVPDAHQTTELPVAKVPDLVPDTKHTSVVPKARPTAVTQQILPFSVDTKFSLYVHFDKRSSKLSNAAVEKLFKNNNSAQIWAPSTFMFGKTRAGRHSVRTEGGLAIVVCRSHYWNTQLK